MIKIYDGRSDFYQWDLERQVIISDPTITEVHFCNKTDECSLVVEVYEKDGLRMANVPNILLQTDWPIHVYAYCGDCYTKTCATFKVIKRTRPADYVYTETEVKRWEDLEKRVDDKIASLDVSEAERMAAEDARAAAEDARAAAEVARAESFDALEQEAVALVDVLDNYYIPTVDEHERRITNIEQHINPNYFSTDDSIAYTKAVPANACDWAQLNSVGGKTYKCKNLIPRYREVGFTETLNGVTFTYREDGGILVKGVPTKGFTYYIWNRDTFANYEPPKIYANTIYTISGGTATAIVNARTYDLKAGTSVGFIESGTAGAPTANFADNFILNSIGIYINNTNERNEVVYPMINEGGTALPYEPYYEGLRDAKVTAIRNYGANLLPFPYRESTTTKYGITYAVQQDGSIKVSGTATAQAGFILAYPDDFEFQHGQTYSWKGATTNTYAVIAYVDNSGTTKYFAGSGSTPLVWDGGYKLVQIYLQVNAGLTVNETIYPMLNYGTTAAPFVPYKAEPTELALPTAITSLEGWGKGIEGYPNTYDFENGIYTIKSKSHTFTGEEVWTYASGDTLEDYWRFYVLKSVLPEFYTDTSLDVMLCNMFDTMAWRSAITGNLAAEFMWYANTSVGVRIHKTRLPNYENLTDNASKVNAFKEWLKNNTLTITGALIEPITEEMPIDFDNCIKVEAGGAIEAVNEYNLAAPTSITYLLKEGSI